MKFQNDLPFIKQGLAVSQISFTGGRTAASLANHGGLTHIDYYGKQAFGDIQFYKADPISAWAMLFRPCVSIDGDLYYLEFNDTLIYPFGYASKCRLGGGGGVTFAHGMWLLNDALVFTLDILNQPAKTKILFKLIHTDVCARIDKPIRTWENFTLDSATGLALAAARSTYPAALPTPPAPKDGLTKKSLGLHPQEVSSETWLGVAATTPLHLRETPHTFRKFYFDAACRKGKNAITLAFGHQGKDAFVQRLTTLRQSAIKEAAGLVQNYQRQTARTKISIPDRPVAQSLLNNVLPIIDAMKVKDLPGAMRAGDSGYWVWGWDSMNYPEGLGLGGDTAFLEGMLELYRRTADPEYGISHAMRLDTKPILTMEFAAQGIYAVLLYYAYALTGNDRLLKEYLPFAKWVVDQAAACEVAGSGLIKSTALYPDQPADLEQDGDDISVFDNSIYYQALRTLAELSTGNPADAQHYTQMAQRTQAGFRKFFDTEQGYFVDSLSAKDFSPRRHYPVYAILWLTPFAADLVLGIEEPVIKFMKKNFPARHGLRMFPKWDTRFMYDGAQLGMYMPVTESFYREMMKRARDAGETSALLDNMEWSWNQLSVLEALTCECENHGQTLDNPGRKQAFAAKAWLNMFYHVTAGLNLSTRGLSFTACQGPNLSIENLQVRGKSVSLDIRGQGWKIGSMKLNGQPVPPPFTIPFTALKKKNRIVLTRQR